MPISHRAPRLAVPALLAVGTLIACSTMAGQDRMSDDKRLDTDAVAGCTSDSTDWAIGQQASAEVVQRIQRETGSQHVRVIKPGQMVTMDYNPNRVNIDVNDRNEVIAVRCG